MVIITGAPCSGKTYHVDANRGHNDIVVDLDRLCVALGSEHSHCHPDSIKAVAQAVRSNLIDSALAGRIPGQVWIVETNPSTDAIERYRTAGAVFRVLDPGETECHVRAHERPSVRETQRAIRSWYLNPPKVPF